MALLKRFSDALRAVFGSNAAAAPSVAKRAARLEQRITRLVDEIPAMPMTAARAITLMEDPDVLLVDIANLIQEDAALATALLRMANSALFAGGSPVLRLDQAVVRLGLWTSKQLVTAVGMRGMLRGRSKETEADRQQLWHHGFVTASICSQLNRTNRLGFKGEEYSAGLLHDLGRLLIALADPDCIAMADLMDFHEEGDVLARERTAIGADHCGLGAWFAELSTLPAELVEVIRHHHAPNTSRLCALVASSDHMANHLHRGESAESYAPLTNPGLSALCKGWAAGRRDALFASLPEVMRTAVAAAEQDLGAI